jgi:hypothetical protein
MLQQNKIRCGKICLKYTRKNLARRKRIWTLIRGTHAFAEFFNLSRSQGKKKKKV